MISSQSISSSKTSFSPESLDLREKWVEQCLHRKRLSAKEAIETTDLLLFFRAYPHSESFALKAEKACREIGALIARSGLHKHPEIIAEGLSGTRLITQFSLSLLQWLNELAPDLIRIESIGADEDTQQEIIALLLPAAEREYFESSDEPTAAEWMKNYTIKSKPLGAILDLFHSNNFNVQIKNYLFEKLHLFVEIRLSSPVLSRSQTRGLDRPFFFHNESFIRTVNVREAIRETLLLSPVLSKAEVTHLIQHKRFHLAALGRETDPGTYSDPRDIQLLDMGRGMHIALYGMDPEHRLPFDAYIGYMAFKNGVPYSYGGAWMLGENAKIGVNIFPPFRGGESAWFFAQLLRAYHQQFGSLSFQVESYQLGKDNSEGLQSGAFWFYYRLGFRPESNALDQLAAREWKTMEKDRTYRTPLSVLKKLVDGDVILRLTTESNGRFPISTRLLSLRVSQTIQSIFGGDRSKAIQAMSAFFSNENGFAFHGINRPEEKKRLEDWLLFFLPYASDIEWTPENRNTFADLACQKIIGCDSTYARLLSTFKPFTELHLHQK
jgi:hypothetical protein